MNTADFGRYVYNRQGAQSVFEGVKHIYNSSGLVSAGTFVGGAFAPELAVAGGLVGLGYGLYRLGNSW